MLSIHIPVPSEYLQPYFEILVGGNEAVEQTTAALAADVREAAVHDDDPDGLYAALGASATKLVGQAVSMHDMHNPWMMISASDQMIPPASNGIAGVAATGLTISTNALRSVGDLYEQYADCPQRRQLVERSQTVALGHAYGLANGSSIAARYTLTCNRLGVDPQNSRYAPVVAPLMYLSAIAQRYAGAKLSDVQLDKAFDVTEPQQDGQLQVVVRHQRRRSYGVGKCPATGNRVGEGAKKPALWQYLRCIGTVALDEIYPRQFDIVN